MGQTATGLVRRLEADAIGREAEELVGKGRQWLTRLRDAVHEGRTITPVERDRFAGWRTAAASLASGYTAARATGVMEAPFEHTHDANGRPLVRLGTEQFRLDPRTAGEINEQALNDFLHQLHRKLDEPTSEDVQIALIAGLGQAVGETPQTLSGGTRDVAGTIARSGYLARVVETELLRGAHAPDETVLAELAGRLNGTDWTNAVIESAMRWATAEPVNPTSDSESMAWRVAGLGGDLRAFHASMLTFATLEMFGYAAPSLPPGWSLDGLQRAFFYGFFLRCGEEALSSVQKRLGADLDLQHP